MLDKKAIASKLDSLLRQITASITAKLQQVFVRDFKMNRRQFGQLVLKSVLVSAIMAFYIGEVFLKTASLSLPYELQLSFFIVGGLTVLFGGIITDFLVPYRYIYEILCGLTIVPMFLLLFIESLLLSIVSLYAIAILAALVFILYFTSILRYTDTLNRARVITLLLSIVVIALIPFVLLLVFEQDIVVSIISTILMMGSVYLVYRYPDDFSNINIHERSRLSFRRYWTIIAESGGIPYMLFLAFTAFTLGFFGASAIEASFSTSEIVAVATVGIISVPLIAGLLDNIGRKTAGYISLFLVGLFCIFFDYPTADPFALNPFRLGVFMFSALLVIIMTAVVAGDLSSMYSRGRITGALLFVTIFGAILGSALRVNYFDVSDFTDDVFRRQVADIATLLIFIVTFAFSLARDSFQSETTEWRNYIDRIYLISENGLAIYGGILGEQQQIEDLQGRTAPNEDLVSGGLTGLQAMLREISMSEKNIEVVNQGDTYIIFHHGEFTKAVLFVRKDLFVLREKLANFHLTFEAIHRDLLDDWNGEVTAFKDLKKLVNYYFS